MPLRVTTRLVGALALLTVAALPASAQMRTQRVRFARGTSSAQYTPRIARGASVRYLVGAQRGQMLTVANHQPTGNTSCRVAVYAPGRSIRPSNAAPSDNGVRTDLDAWHGELSRSGDYQVVLTNSAAAGECGLDISVSAGE